MSKTSTTDRANAAFWQLVEDDEVQEHLRNAAVRLREAGQRLSKLPNSKAVEDKKLYDKLRDAATSLARALKLMGPEPPPRKWRRRVVLLVGMTTATVAAVAVIIEQSRGRH